MPVHAKRPTRADKAGQKGKCKMKTKITKKAIMSAYRNVIKVGYCDLQDALKWREPNYYTAGLYGWNSDVYVIDCDTVIVTGYRPFGNIELPRSVVDALNYCAGCARSSSDYNTWQKVLKSNLAALAEAIKFECENVIFDTSSKNINLRIK